MALHSEVMKAKGKNQQAYFQDERQVYDLICLNKLNIFVYTTTICTYHGLYPISINFPDQLFASKLNILYTPLIRLKLQCEQTYEREL